MNSATLHQQALALLAQAGTRGALVTVGLEGELELSPVAFGKCILNLESELVDHLNSKPRTDAFVAELLQWCEGEQAARAEALRTGGFIMPRGPKLWEIAHVPAFREIRVRS